MQALDSIISVLPNDLSLAISSLSSESKAKLTEIRLRANKPVALKIDNKTVYAEKSGYTIIPNCRCITLNKFAIEDCFIRLCNNSVYSHDFELCEGYISLPFGCRVGVCGTVVKRQDGTYGVRDISSLNIRIAHEVMGCANGLSELSGGILICGAPHSGKTTILRDYIRQCSDAGQTVALIDCRGEIAGSNLGVTSLDVGINTDIFVGGTKWQGIEWAVRLMSPDIVAFDEIGNRNELSMVKECFNAGVNVLTTLHVDSADELLRRNRVLPVLDTDAFEHIVILDRNYKPTVFKRNELFNETIGCNISGDSVCSSRVD